MRNLKALLSTSLLAGASVLTGCVTQTHTMGYDEQGALLADADGVVIANTTLIGETVAADVTGTSSDCEGGYGYGIEVDTVKGDTQYIFDRNGLPCDSAVKIFDGRSKVQSRPSDPSIRIAFRDIYGTVDDSVNKDLAVSYVPEQMSAMETPEEFALSDDDATALTMNKVRAEKPKEGTDEATLVAKVISDAQGPNYKGVNKEEVYTESKIENTFSPSTSVGLNRTISSWADDVEYQKLTSNAEHLLANVRNLQRMSSNELLKEHQKQIKELMVNLRESQRKNAYHMERERMLRNQVSELQLEIDAGLMDREQTERKLIKENAASQQEIAKYRTMAQRIALEKEQAKKALNNELALNRKQVHEAEKQSDYARQEMIYAAAQQIAKAEKQAKEAMMMQRNAMEREAARRTLDARHIAHRAMDLQAGRAIVLPSLPRVSNVTVGSTAYDRIQSTPPTADETVASVDTEMKVIVLEDLGVSLREEEVSLESIFANTLAQLEDRVGKWEVVWNLKEANRTIPKEKWSVLAETTMGDFLAYVQSKVKETHGAELQFRRFDDAHLFVVTDNEE